MDAAVQSRTILVIWHSRTGAARALADAVAEGIALAGQADGAGSDEPERQIAADEAPVVARLLGAAEAHPADMVAAAAYVFAAPENLGTLSGAMKEFFDRCYYPLLGQIEGRAYASAIAAGSAGQGAQAQLDRIVTGWRLRRVAPPLIANLAAQTAAAIAAPKIVAQDDLARCRELGQVLAIGLNLGLF